LVSKPKQPAKIAFYADFFDTFVGNFGTKTSQDMHQDTSTISRRALAKIEKRNAIIAAAEKVFFEKGIYGATMDDVTRQVQFSKATVYVYFKSKDELFFAISQRGNELLQAALRQAADAQNKGVDKVRALGRAYFDFAEKYPHYYKFISYFVSGSDFALSEKLEKEMLHLDQVLVECIEIGLADGSIKKGLDPKVVSKCLWAMATGTLQLVFQKGDLLEKYQNMHREALVNTFFVILEESLSQEGILPK